MKHTILNPDIEYGDELRTIVWDDEAGTVEGDHSEVPVFRGYFEVAAKYGRCALSGGPAYLYLLKDPAHDKRDFLAMLAEITTRGWEVDPGAVLPESLQGVEPTQDEYSKREWPLPPGASY